MSSMTMAEKSRLERLFNMGTGYVLNFTDGSFGSLFGDFDVDIHASEYRTRGSSKANKLRTFWKLADDHLAGRVLVAMLDYHAERFTEMDAPTQALAAQCREIAHRLMGAPRSLDPLKAVAVTFDAAHLQEQIRRMEQSIASDPALAIGTAKELVETCCKTILEQRGKPVKGMPEVSALTKDVLKELKLVPEGVPDASRGSDVIKGILRSLGSIGNDLAQLRGLYGTGHGKHGQATGLGVRHARLAVGAAATFCTFIFETHLESQPKVTPAPVSLTPW